VTGLIWYAYLSPRVNDEGTHSLLYSAFPTKINLVGRMSCQCKKCQPVTVQASQSLAPNKVSQNKEVETPDNNQDSVIQPALKLPYDI
jgi:hypothetical protein